MSEATLQRPDTDPAVLGKAPIREFNRGEKTAEDLATDGFNVQELLGKGQVDISLNSIDPIEVGEHGDNAVTLAALQADKRLFYLLGVQGEDGQLQSDKLFLASEEKAPTAGREARADAKGKQLQHVVMPLKSDEQWHFIGSEAEGAEVFDLSEENAAYPAEIAAHQFGIKVSHEDSTISLIDAGADTKLITSQSTALESTHERMAKESELRSLGRGALVNFIDQSPRPPRQ